MSKLIRKINNILRIILIFSKKFNKLITFLNIFPKGLKSCNLELRESKIVVKNLKKMNG